MTSQQQTLEQKRAASAWEDVTRAVDQAREALRVGIAEAQQKGDNKRVADLQKLVAEFEKEDHKKKFKEAYGSLARKTPALIMTAGLGQALAFLRAKGKQDKWNENNVLFDQLSRWVLQWVPNEGAKDLLDLVIRHGSETYRQATTETLAYLGWLKRFAEAELPESAGGE